MLDIIDEKLLQMKQMAERTKQEKLTSIEMEELNARLNDLATQVRAVDEESRKFEFLF